MSVITPETFTNEDISLSDAYNLVNSLGISYLDFAIESHYYARLFGVLTACDWGCPDSSFVVNQCLRESLYRTLLAVQNDTENFVGYNITDRYHTETIDYPFGKLHSTFAGIDKVDIVPEWSTILGYDSVAVNYFLDTIVAPTVAGGYTYFTVPVSLISNPREVVFRSTTTMRSYTLLNDGVYPKRNGANWEIAIDVGITPYDGNPTYVQHCKYAVVEVAAPTCTNGTVYPVYKGTNQKIPLYKQESIGGGLTRYWFYVYTLVDPAFFSETVNLENGEFYKMMTDIEFRCFKEVTSYAILTKTCNCNGDCTCSDETYRVQTKIVNSETGVVDFCITAIKQQDGSYKAITDCCTVEDDYSSTWKLTYSYKTSPRLLSPLKRDSIGRIRSAMLHKVAAELPLTDCCCEVKQGFIYENQKVYGKSTTNPITGETSVVFKFGDKHGQRVYVEMIQTVPVSRVTFP